MDGQITIMKTLDKRVFVLLVDERFCKIVNVDDDDKITRRQVVGNDVGCDVSRQHLRGL